MSNENSARILFSLPPTAVKKICIQYQVCFFFIHSLFEAGVSVTYLSLKAKNYDHNATAL